MGNLRLRFALNLPRVDKEDVPCPGLGLDSERPWSRRQSGSFDCWAGCALSLLRALGVTQKFKHPRGESAALAVRYWAGADCEDAVRARGTVDAVPESSVRRWDNRIKEISCVLRNLGLRNRSVPRGTLTAREVLAALGTRQLVCVLLEQALGSGTTATKSGRHATVAYRVTGQCTDTPRVFIHDPQTGGREYGPLRRIEGLEAAILEEAVP